jgi:hypothetical protein
MVQVVSELWISWAPQAGPQPVTTGTAA